MNDLTAEQLAEWETYDRFEPIGGWADDYRLAFLCALITNIAISVYGKRGQKMKSPEDFTLKWLAGDLQEQEDREQKRQVQSMDEMKKQLMAIANAFKDKRKRTPVVKNKVVNNPHQSSNTNKK